MKPITPALDFVNQGLAVANLQDALGALLERAAILPNEPDSRQELLTRLQGERARSFYGDVTSKIVGLFQQEQDLMTHGQVDEPTAGALNELLRELGLLDKAGAPRAHIVSGAVHHAGGMPLPGAPVRAFHEDGAVIRLGEDTSDLAGRYTIRYELLPGGESVRLHVAAIGDDGWTLHYSEILADAGAIEIVDLTLPARAPPAARRLGLGTDPNNISMAGITLGLLRHPNLPEARV